MHCSCYYINPFLDINRCTNVKITDKQVLICGSFRIYEILKYLSILPYLPLTLLTCRAYYLAFTGNKPYRCRKFQAVNGLLGQISIVSIKVNNTSSDSEWRAVSPEVILALICRYSFSAMI